MKFENGIEMRTIADKLTMPLSYLVAEASARSCRAPPALSCAWQYPSKCQREGFVESTTVHNFACSLMYVFSIDTSSE